MLGDGMTLKARPQTETETLKFSEGDRVKIVDQVYGHGFKIGQIVTVDKVLVDHNHYRVNGDGDFWHVTDEEIEAAEATTTVEIEEGDIVRTVSGGGSLLSVGEIGVVGEFYGDAFRVNTPSRKDVNWVRAEHVELIAKKADRHDL